MIIMPMHIYNVRRHFVDKNLNKNIDKCFLRCYYSSNLFEKSYDEEGRVAEFSERRRLVRAVSKAVQSYRFRAEAPKAARQVDSFRRCRVKA